MQPNTFSTEALLAFGAVAYDLGFQAGSLRVENHGGSPIRVNLSSSASSTDGELVGALQVREFRGIQLQRFCVATTATATSTGSSAQRMAVRLHAVGA